MSILYIFRNGHRLSTTARLRLKLLGSVGIADRESYKAQKNLQELAMKTPEPASARPVFSTADFALLKEAVADYTRKIADDPRSVQFANLYHRLGRLG